MSSKTKNEPTKGNNTINGVKVKRKKGGIVIGKIIYCYYYDMIILDFSFFLHKNIKIII